MSENYTKRLINFAPWYFFLLSTKDNITRAQAVQWLSNLLLYGAADPDCETSRWELKRSLREAWPDLYQEVLELNVKDFLRSVGIGAA